MTDFARSGEQFNIGLQPKGTNDSSVVVYFGPPNAGSLTISVDMGGGYFGNGTPPTNPGGDNSPTIARVDSSANPRLYIGSISGGGAALKPAQGSGNDGSSTGQPLPQYQFQIEVYTSGNTQTPIAQGLAPLTIQVPEPHTSVVSSISAIHDNTAKWKIRITNLSDMIATGVVIADYVSYQPVLSTHIDIEALNQLFDRIFNQDLLSRPLTMALENRLVSESWDTVVYPGEPGVEYTVPHGEDSGGIVIATETIHVEKTFIRFPADPIIGWQYAGIDHMLPAKIVEPSLTSFPISPRFTINDNRLALKIDIEFPTITPKFLTRNLIESVTPDYLGITKEIAGYLADSLLGLNENQIRRLGIDVTLTMRDTSLNVIEGPGDTCDVLIEPHIELDGANATVTFLASAVLEAISSQLYMLKAYSWAGDETFDGFRKAAESIWLTLARYLLRRDQPFLLGQMPPQSIDLLYAGDPPLPPTLIDEVAPEVPVKLPEMGTLAHIDHIVVLMMENRSFDHMLGYLSLPESLHGRGRTDVDGLRGTEWNYDRMGNRHYIFPFEGDGSVPFGFDPGHGFDDQQRQRGNWNFTIGPNVPSWEPSINLPFHVDPMGGFAIAYHEQLQRAIQNGLYKTSDLTDPSRGYGGNPAHIMGYHTPEQVPMYDFLATQYCICDRWFAPHPGDTWPNRFITLTGDLAPKPPHDPHAGFPEIGTPRGDTFTPVHIKNIFDYLTEAGISWRYYEHDLCMLRLFADYTLGHPNIVQINDKSLGLEAAVKNAKTFPSVTFIDPDLNDVPAGNDDHPPIAICQGQALVQRVYTALSSNPDLWSRTLLIVTYDEYGGFYDHVYPAPVSDPNDPEYISCMFTYPEYKGQVQGPYNPQPVHYRGPRVPAFIVSPWVKPGAVSHTTFDHTSILKTIVARFLHNHPPYLGERYARANSVLAGVPTLDKAREAVSAPLVTQCSYTSLTNDHSDGDFQLLKAAFQKSLQHKLKSKGVGDPLSMLE